MLKIYFSKFDTPVGPGIIGGFEGKVCWLSFKDEGHKFNRFINDYVNNVSSGKLKQNFARFKQKYPTIARMIIANNFSIIQDEVPFKEIVETIHKYYNGEKVDFNAINTIYLTGTAFQHKVWDALKTIEYGQTISYQQLAEKINKPSAFRAAGNANGKNIIPLIIPCHRVIKADATLGGYSGGLDIKEKLLEIEGITL